MNKVQNVHYVYIAWTYLINFKMLTVRAPASKATFRMLHEVLKQNFKTFLKFIKIAIFCLLISLFYFVKYLAKYVN